MKNECDVTEESWCLTVEYRLQDARSNVYFQNDMQICWQNVRNLFKNLNQVAFLKGLRQSNPPIWLETRWNNDQCEYEATNTRIRDEIRQYSIALHGLKISISSYHINDRSWGWILLTCWKPFLSSSREISCVCYLEEPTLIKLWKNLDLRTTSSTWPERREVLAFNKKFILN